MAVHLVTGYAGAGHVTSADYGLLNAGIFGPDRYVMQTGTQFEYTLQNNNLITIGSGDLIDQGRHISIPTNTTVDVSIENGSQGMRRYDLIVMRYSKDSSTSIESASLEIIKGTESSGTPTLPACITGDIFSGAQTDDVPLYRIYINGLTVQSVTPLFTVIDSFTSIQATLLNAVYPVGSVYISARSTSPATLFGGTWTQLKGRFLIGASATYAAGETGGETMHTLTASEMPAHTHSGPNHRHTIPAHTHTVPRHTHTAQVDEAGAHTHTLQRQLLSAAGTARYAAQSASSFSGTTYTTTSSGAHTHEAHVAYASAFATESGGSGNTGYAGTGATGSAGSGGAHNNMPPYLAVYMWQRTA